MRETSAALLNAVVTATPEIAALVDADGEVAWINPAFVTRWPCAQAPTVDGLLDVVDPGDHAAVEEAWEELRSGESRSVVRRARLGCAHTRTPGRIRLTRVDSGGAAGSVVIHVEEADGAGVSRTGHDPLTGLLDRTGLLSHLDALLAAGTPACLALIDLDRFRLVNESLGHTAGDDLLVTVARRLRAQAHDDDIVARVSADEFAVICAHVDRHGDLVDALRAGVHEPIPIGADRHVLDCCVGVVSLEVVSGSIEAMAAADSAVYLAKSRGRGRVEIFDTGLRDSAIKTLRRTSELQHAADNDEFVLRYQPIVELSTGVTVGCEALLRWLHPEAGELGAGEFIDIAEASGLVNELTPTLLTKACLAAERLSRTRAGTYVSVNLSPRQLGDQHLLDHVDHALARSGIEPRQLVLEITETAVLDDVPAAVAALCALRQRGVRIALDDFGTGFSSLLRLRELPVDCLKVDRAFVAGIARSRDDLAIVASVVNMAATLGLDCIAEGVESEEQAEQLRRLGCATAQGYLWSPAVPLHDVPLQPGLPPRSRPQPRLALRVDPESEAWIMRLHRSGASLHSIAAVLNAAGERTDRGTRWHPRIVARVISRAAYPQLDA
ncbi:MAG: bifunctional diguanylate cyclase/phosphodiesterase [Frankiaceae bacterium]|nr:bifunctional diguanylate cyclase/phosphodiesterase [Frankiaceae bacterium]MBV9369481.1 bifunctional diguanylate cyclase/phosphodiesterase [Frankiales bacterium]